MTGGADEPELVTDQDRLTELVGELGAAPRYAIDTEFHRERTYYPHLALVQIAWEGGLVLVDPLALDVAPLAEVFEGPGVAVLHACDQDLEVLAQTTGAIPARIFDTQVAASFLGMATPSLAAIHSRFLDLKLPKGDRLTDWLARPLSGDQIAYAASDVAHLLELHDLMVDQLGAAGRLSWVEDECEDLRGRARGARDPEQAWLRIKEARQLRGRKLAVAQELAAWREERAQRRDQPVRFVLPDLAVVGVAQRAPTSLKQLKATRGVDERYLRSGAGEEILAAVARGEQREPWPGPVAAAELERRLRPVVTLVSAWLSQRARELELDVAMLATRNDIEELLAGEPDARLQHGWRREVAGEGIRRLVDGEAALAFDGRGGLVLEPRAGR